MNWASNNNGNLSNKQDNNTSKNFYTKQIEQRILELKSKYNVTSIRQFFSAIEIFINLPIPKGQFNQIQLKIFILQNFPIAKPIIYVTRPLNSPIINQFSGEILYEQIYKWTNRTKLLDVINKIHIYLMNNNCSQANVLQALEFYKKELDVYGKQINRLPDLPLPINIIYPFTMSQMNVPKAPQFDFTGILESKSFEQKLHNEYSINSQENKKLLIQFKQTESKANYVSERFSRGKILKQIESEMSDFEFKQNESVQDMLIQFQKKRKDYHKLAIIRQKYLEN